MWGIPQGANGHRHTCAAFTSAAAAARRPRARRPLFAQGSWSWARRSRKGRRGRRGRRRPRRSVRAPSSACTKSQVRRARRAAAPGARSPHRPLAPRPSPLTTLAPPLGLPPRRVRPSGIVQMCFLADLLNPESLKSGIETLDTRLFRWCARPGKEGSRESGCARAVRPLAQCPEPALPSTLRAAAAPSALPAQGRASAQRPARLPDGRLGPHIRAVGLEEQCGGRGQVRASQEACVQCFDAPRCLDVADVFVMMPQCRPVACVPEQRVKVIPPPPPS